MTRGDQIAMAEELVRNRELAPEFLKSVQQMATYRSCKPFYPQNREPRGPAQTIERTADLAKRLERAGSWQLESRTLGYLDREIRPLRTTGGAKYEQTGSGGATRSSTTTPMLDLLLTDQEGVPAIAEVKLRRDQNLFYALVQALMHAAALSTPAQRRRLAAHTKSPVGCAAVRVDGPIDVLLLVLEAPVAGTGPRLAQLARTLAFQLVASPGVGGHLRCIETVDVGPTGTSWKSLWTATAD